MDPDIKLPPGFAVVGIIGPDSVAHRQALRSWTHAVAPGVVARFAVSLRDRAEQPWLDSAAAPAESDVDFIDCLGQYSGAAVVIIHLFDAWLRHAVARYPFAHFIGRADSDAIPSPHWLPAMLAAEALRQARANERSPMVLAGSMQWYNWDEIAFRPWGWAMGPWNARRRAISENKNCTMTSSPRCAGPFPFAAGPLLLLSTPLARWYIRSESAANAVATALDSRLNRTSDEIGGGTLSLEAARTRGQFMRLSEPGDLDVRVFDDVFLGHALCVGDGGDLTGKGAQGVGGPSNVTVLSFPPGLFSDFPCNGGERGCRNGLNRFNWTALGAPLLAHRIRKPQYVPIALELIEQTPFKPQVFSCKPMQPTKAEVPLTHCLGRNWQWCQIPFTPSKPLQKEAQMAAAKSQEARNKAHGFRNRLGNGNRGARKGGKRGRGP